MDFDSLPEDTQPTTTANPIGAAANMLGDYAKGKWDEAGQQAHQTAQDFSDTNVSKALSNLAQGKESGLPDLGENLAMATVGGEGVAAPGAVDKLGLYSKLERTMADKLQPTESVGRVNNLLQDIKPEERKYSGIDEYLKDKTSVNKDDLLSYLQQNGLNIDENVYGGMGEQDKIAANVKKRLGLAPNEDIPFDKLTEDEIDKFNTSDNGVEKEPKFQAYSTPGGENYKERVYTIPEKTSPEIEGLKKQLESLDAERDNLNEKMHSEMKPAYGEEGYTGLSNQEDMDKFFNLTKKRAELTDQIDAVAGPENNFHSSHYPSDTGYLAHARTSDRVDSEGNPLLHIDEIQSDLHQKGREEGYGTPPPKLSDEERLALVMEREAIAERIVAMHKTDAYANLETGELSPAANALEDKYTDINSQLGVVKPKGVPDAPLKNNKWAELVIKRLLNEAAQTGQKGLSLTSGIDQVERYGLPHDLSRIELSKDPRAPLNSGEFNYKHYDTNGNTVEQNNIDVPSLEDMLGKKTVKRLLEAPSHPDSSGLPVRIVTGTDAKTKGDGLKDFYNKVLPEYLNKLGKPYGAKVDSTVINTPQGPKTVHRFLLPDAMKSDILKNGLPKYAHGGFVKFDDLKDDNELPNVRKMLVRK